MWDPIGGGGGYSIQGAKVGPGYGTGRGRLLFGELYRFWILRVLRRGGGR